MFSQKKPLTEEKWCLVEQLFKKHERFMMTLAMRYLQQRDDAEDLLQDILLRLFDCVDRYDFSDEQQSRALLGFMVKGKALDRLKKRARESMLEPEQLESMIVAEDEEEQLLTRLSAHTLLQKLPRYDAELLHERFICEMSYEEIAAGHALKTATARKQVQRAIDKLAKQIGREENCEKKQTLR